MILGLNLLTVWQLCFRGCWVIKSPVTTALFQSLWFYHGTVMVIPCYLRMWIWKPFKNMSRSKPEEKKTNFALFLQIWLFWGDVWPWDVVFQRFSPLFPFCTVETWWHAHVLRNVVPSSTSQMTAGQECQRLLIDVIVLCFLSQWLPVQTPTDRRLGRWEVLPSAAFCCKLLDTAHTHTGQIVALIAQVIWLSKSFMRKVKGVISSAWLGREGRHYLFTWLHESGY